MDMAKPKIRFKGYQEDWEQRKLGDWGTFYYGRSCPKWSVTEDATIPCIRYGELYTKFGAKIDKVYSYTNMSPESLRFSKGTEVLIPRVGEDPMDYNHCTWLSMPDVAIGEMISVFNTENNPLFTATMFNATLQNEFAMRVEGGSVTNLYFEKLKNIDVLFPSLEEQEKIATYFDSLDHLITLHQRKCDQTKKLKKFMLQKMFPQNGKKVPELRFSEFTDDWEQRKLGEIVVRITRKNQDLVSTLPLTISAQYGLIDQNEFFDKRVASKDVSGYYLINNGEFAYNKSTSSDAPWGAIKRLDRYENGVLSTLYIVFAIKEDVEVDSDYLVTYYDTDLWHRGVREIAAEGARNHGLLNIAPADFFETSLVIPQDIEEQKAIGKCFSELNALITLHQRELYLFVKRESFAWEQRKLGEVAKEFKSGNSLKADEIGITGDYPVYGGNGLRGYTSTYNHDGEFALIGRQGALCGNMNYSVGKAYFTEHAVVVKADENNDTKFMYYMLDTMNLGQYSDQSAQPGLAVNKLVKLENLFPQKEEQQRIGLYFSNVDHLITLHQREHIRAEYILKYIIYSKGEGENGRIRKNNRRKINRSIGLW